jgi:hypothetical protein
LTWRSTALRRVLQVVAPSGHGSATRLQATTLQDDGFDPYGDWSNARTRDVVVTSKAARLKRAAIAIAIPLTAFLVVIKLFAPQAEVATVEPFKPPVATPQQQETPSNVVPATDRFRSYALEITELDGLPPDASPGTALEIWVTWEPPITRRIRVQRLIQQARVERIIPNIVPEGPATVLLSIPRRDIADMFYGDRFGQLSAAILPTHD